MNGRQEDIASAVPADLDCISAAPAALDHYLVALPAMSLIPVAPLYLGCLPQRSTTTSWLYRPCRSSQSLHSLPRQGES
jgi:hypothetical protein